MKSWRKILLTTCLAMGLTGMYTAQADNLDTYRNLLIKKTYTIKYENVTPQARQTNKDKVTLTGKNTMNTEGVSQYLYKPMECTVVADGTKRYEEVGTGGMKTCRLQNEKGTYVFTLFKVNDLVRIYGSKLGEVAALPTNRIAYLRYGDSFGGDDVTRVLNAMLPDEKRSMESSSYHYVDEGWLDNGQNYVDYRWDGPNGDMEVIRYYFDGYTLVKISSAQFNHDENGELQARRTIIKINEFSPTPDQKLLTLPSGVKDVTKVEKAMERAGVKK